MIASEISTKILCLDNFVIKIRKYITLKLDLRTQSRKLYVLDCIVAPVAVG